VATPHPFDLQEHAMTDQDLRAETREWFTLQLRAERERGRRLRTATSALSTAALGLVVSLALPWAVSADENSPDFDPTRALQLDEPGPWRADGWFLLRDAVGNWGEDGSAPAAVLTVLPLLCAVVAGWALVRQERRSAFAAKVAGGIGVVGLVVIGVRLVVGPGVDLGAGFWLAVASAAVLACAAFALDRAVRTDDA
jgi:hypothetical protein